MKRELLTEAERESFDRAMTTIDVMTSEDRRALLAHSVAASVRYATGRDVETLTGWCSGLLATLRVHADPQYQAALRRRTTHQGATIG